VASSLQAVDVVVNCVGSKGDTMAFNTALIDAIAKVQSVKMYVASEFGVDHYIHGGTDADFDFAERRHKKELCAEAKRVFGENGRDDIRMVSVGLWFGMDCREGRCEAVGDAEQRCSYTSKGDVGKAVAVLATMIPSDVPEKVRVSGDSMNMRDIANEMGEARGCEIEVNSLDAEAFARKGLVQEDLTDPSKYVWVLIGNGKIDFSGGNLDNQNELVNPGEGLWKWESMREYTKETKGGAWTD
jgi:hypothetical protein